MRIQMKKKYLSKLGIFLFALIFCISPITVSASSKTLTEPLGVTPAEEQVGNTGEEATIQREEISYGPLTPEGNMDLIDDYGSTQGAGKQFITVETKNGEYFYIIIDRDDNGTETVHFLNKVDEADLLAVMEEEAVQEYLDYTAEKETADTEGGGSEALAEKPTEDLESVEGFMKEPAVIGLPPLASLLLIGGVIGVGGIGGYLYLKKVKIKPSPETIEEEEEEDLSADLDETDLDDEDLDAEEGEE